jgi:hypothetical protein
MLGRKNLQQLLQVTLLADMNAAPRAQELVRLSVIRALLPDFGGSRPSPLGT